MFSGIIEKKAKILAIDNGTFTIENIWNTPLKIGESIAHDGACMTVTESNETEYQFFVMEESIKKTNFKHKNPWDTFNVEKSLQIGSRLDGHMVSWHIDTTGKVIKISKNDDTSLYLYISFDKIFKNLIIPKGSITLSGVSLTIVEDNPESLSVSLIPLTQEWTNLWDLQVWDTVNIEFDIFWKYVNKIYNKS